MTTTAEFQDPKSPPVDHVQRCSAAVDGRACKGRRVTGSRYCYFHAPELAQRRKAAQRRGATTANLRRRWEPADLPTRFTSIADLLQLNEALIRGSIQGSVEPDLARAVEQLIRLQANLIADHVLESRVDALESRSSGGASS